MDVDGQGTVDGGPFPGCGCTSPMKLICLFPILGRTEWGLLQMLFGNSLFFFLNGKARRPGRCEERENDAKRRDMRIIFTLNYW